MNAAASVAGFAAVLVAVFASSAGLGAAIGPEEAPEPAAHGSEHGSEHESEHGSEQGAAPVAELPGGLMVSQDGYTLRLASATRPAGRDVPLRFTVTGPDGEPVAAYDVEHEKELHLVAVRRDLVGFQHVHPTRAPDGTWSTDLDLAPGTWRVFADFAATGAEPLTLGTDLFVPGQAAAPPRSDADVRTARVDGYEVRLDGDLTGGEASRLTLSVSRDGEPVTDLEPYLGAYGHLVALRAGDLAYLHVHPEGGRGPVAFRAEVPSEGAYHLFLDFKHDGVVRTAAFSVRTGE